MSEARNFLLGVRKQQRKFVKDELKYMGSGKEGA